MSAFAVIFNLDAAPVKEQELHSMNSAVSHRGPDGMGVWASGSVGMGACLLKTTPEADFETLPLVSVDGRYAVAMDGRIDNRAELARELGEAGHSWSVTPDSAALLAAYRKWGKRCVEHIAGDFSFAIWDSVEQEVFLARDPIGVRLLHYYCDGKRFIAATEISQLLSVVKADVDPLSLALFINLQTHSSDRTFYKEIKRLPGGYRMTVSSAGPKTDVYWEPDPSDFLRLKDDREYEEQFLELFKEAVRSRMRRKTPVAVSLSGGMDSSAVLAVAEHMRLTDKDLPDIWYYSSVYSGMESVDETEYIKPTIEKYGTSGKLLESRDFGEHKSSPIGIKRSEPIIAPHEESQRRLFAAAQAGGHKTLLTGLGGDEVFSVGTGYLIDLYRSFNLRAIRREWRYFNWRAWRDTALAAARSYVPIAERPEKMDFTSLLSKSARDSIEAVGDSGATPHRSFNSRHCRDVEGWVQMRGRLPGYTWTDTTVAEYGLEPTHPFMDIRVAEFLVSVPPELKFRFGYTKRVLRRSVKGILPEYVRNRRYKTDFSPLFDEKATQSDVDANSRLLSSSMLADMGLVDAGELQKAWSEYVGASDRVDNDQRTSLWVVITIEQWLRQNMVAGGEEGEIGATLPQHGPKLFAH